MIKKVKASTSEKIIFYFLIVLAITTLSTFIVIKNKCLFIKNHNPQNINFEKPNNIAILKMDIPASYRKAIETKIKVIQETATIKSQTIQEKCDTQTH